MVAQSKATEVLDVLKTAADSREVESKLLHLLGPSCFTFIKTLRQYRNMSKYYQHPTLHPMLVFTVTLHFFAITLYL